MASRKKPDGSSRTRRRSRGSTVRARARSRRAWLEQLLSTTAGRVLAVAAAVGTITGAIAGVLALLPSPPAVLKASFTDVTANPETSLEQYDAHAGTISGAARTASVGRIVLAYPAYTLLADTTPTSGERETTTTGATEPQTFSGPAGEPTSTSETTPAPPARSGSTTTTHATTNTSSTTTTSPSPVTPSPPRRHLTRKGAKRPGGRIVLSAPPTPTPYPREHDDTRVQSQRSQPTPTLHPVQGALVSEGTGVSHAAVAAVLGFIASRTRTSEAHYESAPARSGETEAPTAPTSAPSPRADEPTPEPRPTRIILPSSCRTSTCGATNEVEKAVTYDSDPIKAAEAVAAIFDDSRAEVVGKLLYPVGAEVTYGVDLEGFAGKDVTLEWSLVDRAGKRPLARPWWRNIVVAHIVPKLENESLDGAFWVPEPPERGDYLVHLVLRDADGVPHASSYSAPAFH